MEGIGWAAPPNVVGQMQYRPPNGGAGLAGPSPVDESASKIRDAVGMTEEALSQLHGTIDRLEKRLHTVLTPAPPTVNGGETKQAPPVDSPLLSRIGSTNVVIMQAIERLSRITHRIEI